MCVGVGTFIGGGRVMDNLPAATSLTKNDSFSLSSHHLLILPPAGVGLRILFPHLCWSLNWFDLVQLCLVQKT